jgi:hypothetical protein
MENIDKYVTAVKESHHIDPTFAKKIILEPREIIKIYWRRLEKTILEVAHKEEDEFLFDRHLVGSVYDSLQEIHANNKFRTEKSIDSFLYKLFVELSDRKFSLQRYM